MGRLTELNEGILVHLDDLDFLGKQIDRFGIEVINPVDGPQLGLLGTDIDDVFQIFGKLVISVLVEEDGTLASSLMDAGLDDVLGDFVESHGVVHGRRREFGGINDAAFQG